MKDYEISRDSFAHSDERDLVPFFSQDETKPALLYTDAEYSVRIGLTSALGELGTSVHELVKFLDEHHILTMLPPTAVTQYGDILEKISSAAIEGTRHVRGLPEPSEKQYFFTTPDCARLQ